MRNLLVSLFALAVIYIGFYNYFFDNEAEIDKIEKLKSNQLKSRESSADHSNFAQLNKKFNKAQDLTSACLSCHNKSDNHFMKTAHWNWEKEEYISGRGVTSFGKKNAINNFCIGIGGSEVSCTRCHAGYGWKDASFNFKDSSSIDCIVCHDNSGTYFKAKDSAGYPDASVDLSLVAKSVGKPRNENCGACHFFGGGGNNVKHGDLEKSILTANEDLDVHMNIEGMSMVCTDCHTAEDHIIKGKMYSVSSMNRNRLFCEDCHTLTPHKEEILNEHTVKVACQTCHIPDYSRINSTKMSWDWSKAGKLKDGKPFAIEDEKGNDTYLSIKGEFVWEDNVIPEYTFFNGTADHYFIGDKIDTSKIIRINTLNGSYNDRNSKIIPIKIHRAKQIFDCDNKMIIQPKLFAEKEGEGGYWKDFDWNLAAKMGMQNVGEPYSGHFCFVKTEMSWPINHMVVPKERTLKCESCHTRNNSRLKDLKGFYMPGRDYNASIEILGWLMIILTTIAVFVHGAIRLSVYYLRLTKEKDKE